MAKIQYCDTFEQIIALQQQVFHLQLKLVPINKKIGKLLARIEDLRSLME